MRQISIVHCTNAAHQILPPPVHIGFRVLLILRDVSDKAFEGRPVTVWHRLTRQFSGFFRNLVITLEGNSENSVVRLKRQFCAV